MAHPAAPEAIKATGLVHKTKLGDDPTAPLALLVHGRAGNGDVMWAFRRCVPEAWNIIAPEAPIPDPVGGFSWWNIQTTDARTGATHAVQLLERFLAEAQRFYGLTPRFVTALGFSQGAGTISLLAQKTNLLAGAGLLAGFVIETDTPTSADTRIFMAHGTTDEMVPIERAHRGRDYLLAHGFRVEYVEDPVGHKVGTTGMRALKAFLDSFSS